MTTLTRSDSEGINATILKIGQERGLTPETQNARQEWKDIENKVRKQYADTLTDTQ